MAELESSALTDKSLRMSYRIGRGEQGVLTFEPYKSHILPLWRFRTPDIARKSSQELWDKFEEYRRRGDFVGMDMTRKFIQMVIRSLRHDCCSAAIEDPMSCLRDWMFVASSQCRPISGCIQITHDTCRMSIECRF